MSGVPLSTLQPGDLVKIGTSVACYVGRIDPHPLHVGMALVIWRLDTGGWSLDALGNHFVIQGESDTAGNNEPGAQRRRLMQLHNALTKNLAAGRLQG